MVLLCNILWIVNLGVNYGDNLNSHKWSDIKHLYRA